MRKVLNVIKAILNYLVFPLMFFCFSLKTAANLQSLNLRVDFCYDILTFISTILIISYIKVVKVSYPLTFSFINNNELRIEPKIEEYIGDCKDSVFFIESNNPFLYSDKTVSLNE